jgi:hypothetical protein
MVPMDVVAVLKIQDAVTPGADVVAPKIGRMETVFSGIVEDALDDDALGDALDEDALKDALGEDALEDALDEGALEDALGNSASDDDDTLDGFAYPGGVGFNGGNSARSHRASPTSPGLQSPPLGQISSVSHCLCLLHDSTRPRG